MSLAAGTRLGSYEILAQIGAGGMGEVYRARDPRLDREVALKILPGQFAGDRDRRTLFAREARAIAALNHPNIVTVYSVEEADETFFFTMELVRGVPLSDNFSPEGVDLPRLLQFAIPLADAVSAAHERGIVHCDLKPANVLVTETGVVKIVDFGLARCLKSVPAIHGLPPEDSTATEIPTGATLAYASPEQLRGEPLDHRSDLFSLGIILYELASGRHPFEGSTGADFAASILRDTPLPVHERNSRLPWQLGAVLQHCLEKDVTRRIQAAADLRYELEHLQERSRSPQEEVAPAVAVLPFMDLSREKDQEYFCQGIAEELIYTLGRIEGLHVAARTASFQFKGAGADSREIGHRLRVNALLEGSVRKSGSRLRIAARLVDVEGGYHLWSETYDRDFSDVFAVQEEIARNIANALKLQLTAHESEALRRAPTSHAQAYDYYLRGRHFFFRFGKRDVEFALQLFSRAAELDPAYVLAHAGLADCWSFIYLYAERSDETRAQACRESGLAVELDPRSAQAHASRGLALSLGDGEGAEKEFEEALRLDPNLFEACYFYGRFRFARGEREKAAELFERAMRIRPEDYQAPLLIGQIYQDMGRQEDAARARRLGVEIAERHLRSNPQDGRAMYMAANGLAALGEKQRACEWTERALEVDPDDAMLLYNLGCVYALLGLPEEALNCLERSVQHGLRQKGWFLHDGDLHALRGAARFQKLIRELEG
jgi:TolB-like protein/Tfp pilus assembly protein PilF